MQSQGNFQTCNFKCNSNLPLKNTKQNLSFALSPNVWIIVCFCFFLEISFYIRSSYQVTINVLVLKQGVGKRLFKKTYF